MAAISSSSLLPLGLCLLALLQNPCGGSTGEYFLSGNASYISFSAWPVCSDRGASIGLHFRTLRQKSLLFYVEDSKGKQHFVLAEIKDGRLSVEASLDDRINIHYENINVSDGRWHQLSLKLNKDMLKVDLDDQSRVRSLVNGATTTLQALSKPIYVGGFPSNMQTIELVLYTVAFLNNFSGSIRDITTMDCRTFHNQKLEPYRLHGVRPATPCSRGRACQNGGRCIDGVCDCTGTKFEGDLCEKIASPMVATFDGKSYISMYVRNQVSFGDNELVQLKMKTKMADSFIFCIGIKEKSVHAILYLESGKLNFKVLIGSQMYPANHAFGLPKKNNVFGDNLEPRFRRFDDNNWHSISLQWRNPQERKLHKTLDVQLKVDEQLVLNTSIPTPQKLSARRLYLAGAGKDTLLQFNQLFGAPQVNFTGCIEDATYTTRGAVVRLISLAQARKVVRPVGSPLFERCQESFSEKPVSFTKSGAFLRVPRGWSSAKEGNFSIRFRTTEPDGLLLYQRGNGSNPDFLALELRSKDLFLLIDAGSGTRLFNVIQEVRASKFAICDGKDHVFKLNFSNRTVDFSLDNYSTRNIHLNKPTVVRKGQIFREINLRPEIYLGSLPPDGIIPPHELWSAVVRRGFVGCISSLGIDDRPIDLGFYAARQASSALVTDPAYCKQASLTRCGDPTLNPSCKNGGICRNGWKRVICDCSFTNYTGEYCEKVASVLSFDGTQWMRISLPREVQSETEDVLLRFKTTKRDGLLFTAFSRRLSEGDNFELKVEDGYLIVIFNFGRKPDRRKIESVMVSDGHWHTVRIRRRATIVKVAVDGDQPNQNIIYDVKEETSSLVLKFIFIGGYPTMLSDDNKHGRLLDVSTYKLGYVKASRPGYQGRRHERGPYFFVGHMMHFTLNGVNYFELAHEESPASIEVTASFSSARAAIRELPVTFKTAVSYLKLPRLQIYYGFSIELAFKTTQASGIILYNEGMTNNKRGDFLLIELVSGNLHLSFDVGAGQQRVTSSKKNLNDDRWHLVRLSRQKDVNRLDFRVDEKLNRVTMNGGAKGINFNFNQPLYLGGFLLNTFSAEKGFLSKMGFQGCLASLSFNAGKITDALAEGKKLKEFKNDIARGCAASGARCRKTSCHYTGHCIQQWTQTRCNCEMTSFIGKYCSNVSSTLLFGKPKGGIVRVEYQSRKRNTKRDEMALGIQTTSGDVTVVNVIGEGSPRSGFDYISMVILPKGFVQFEYFTGKYVEQVTERRINVADGNYHIVRFTRDGANAWIEIDDRMTIFKNKRPDSTLHFNRQRWIFLGGADPSRATRYRGRGRYPRAVRHFRRALVRARGRYMGVVSGFVFNGLPITDLVAGRTTRPSIRVSMKYNVTVLHNFKPRLKGFPPPDPVPELSAQSLRNEMLSTTSESQSPSTTDSNMHNGGIVLPKPVCPKYTGGKCISPAPGNGLVQAHVSTTFASTTTAPPIRTEAPRVPKEPGIIAKPSEMSPGENKQPQVIWDPKPLPPKDGTTTTNLIDTMDASLNLWLIVAISCGGLVFLVLIICLIYRCRRRDEGSYSVESNQRDFGGDPACKPLRDSTSFMNGTSPGGGPGPEPTAGGPPGVILGGTMTATPLNNRNGAGSTGFGSSGGSGKRKKGRRKETKEWYV